MVAHVFGARHRFHHQPTPVSAQRMAVKECNLIRNTLPTGSNNRTLAIAAVPLVVGQRIRIVHSPASYSYNGRVGVIEAISGDMITVQVDEHPTDVHCTIFYVEELEREGNG